MTQSKAWINSQYANNKTIPELTAHPTDDPLVTTDGYRKLYVNRETNQAYYLITDAPIPQDELEPLEISTSNLINGILSADVTGRAKMADGFVTAEKIANGFLSADVTGRAKMADGFVTAEKIADGEIPYSKLDLEGEVTNADLAGNIDGEKLNDASITGEKLALDLQLPIETLSTTHANDDKTEKVANTLFVYNASKVRQCVTHVNSTAQNSSTNTDMLSSTVPSNTKGIKVFDVQFTPTKDDSIIEISFSVPTGATDTYPRAVAVFINGAANASYTQTSGTHNTVFVVPVVGSYIFNASSKAKIDIMLRCGQTYAASQYVSINKRYNGDNFGNSLQSIMKITEYAPA